MEWSKILKIDDIGYSMITKNTYHKLVTHITFFFPAITHSLDDANKFYLITSRIKGSLMNSNTVHFYVNNKEALNIYEKNYDSNSFDKEEFIDLVVDEKVKLSKNSRHRIHTWLKRARNNGVKVRILNQIDDSELIKEWYYSCYTYVHDNRPPYSYHQLYNYFDYLLKKRLSLLIIAEKDGKIHGLLSILLDDFSDVAFFNPAAVCEEGRKSGAGYLLVSTAIDILKERGMAFEL